MAIKIQYESIRTDLEIGDILFISTKLTEKDVVAKVSNKYRITKIETHRIKDINETNGYTVIQIEAI